MNKIPEGYEVNDGILTEQEKRTTLLIDLAMEGNLQAQKELGLLEEERKQSLN